MDQHRLLELAGVELLTEKLDANQEFTIATCTRATIAEKVNEALSHHNLHVPQFEPGDARLTPQFCKAFAAHIMDWHEGFQSHWMHSEEAIEQVSDFISEIGQQALRQVPQKKPAAKKATDK